MGKTAFLCVDEGVQRVGMGIDFVPLSQHAADIFTLANDASGLEIFDLCAQGPQDELDQTQNAQPCLVTTSLAIAAALRDRGVEPDCVAGVGVGEYVAHAIAGTIDEERALMLVARRGAMMAMAKHRKEGGLEMAARNMERAYKSTIFVEPPTRMYSSVSGVQLDISQVNELLLSQITGTERWTDAIDAMLAGGITRFIELGPGKRLSQDVRARAEANGMQVETVSIADALDFELFC